MTLALNKTFFVILLIVFLLLIGISGVYGGYYMETNPAEIPTTVLQILPASNSFNWVLLFYIGIGLLPMVAAAWLITRLCFVAWSHRKGITRSITI